ncbi:MAG: GNAT family N-acetyltransferase [Actinobacteria bacterium]|nr:MAG: GNAT family N-acetyltransferase [Actinomycetota bacterium]
MVIAGAMRLFAEEPDRYLPDPALPARRLLDARFVFFLGPTPFVNLVSSVRVDARDVAALVEEIRACAGPERRRVAWVVGPSCEPGDLRERLEALGFVPADRPPFESVTTAMALTEPPAVGGTDAVFVRPVESFEDYVLSDEITSAGFGVDERERAAFAGMAPERFAAYRERDDYLRFLAFVDKTPVASAAANACELGLFLGGAATLRAARGQGAYRALVRARWDEAVKRGTPALVILAGAMSRPILERVGFERVCDLTVLFDPQTGD